MRHSSAFADSIAHRSLCSRCRTSQWKEEQYAPHHRRYRRAPHRCGRPSGTGAVILHRAVPAELRDHLLGVGVALVIIGLLAAIAVVYRAHCGSGVLDRRAAVVLLPSFIVIGGFPLLFMAVLNMPDAVTGGLIGIQLGSAFFLGILIRYLHQYSRAHAGTD